MRPRQVVLAAVLATGISTSAQSANWLTLHGTEPAGSSERARIWGFIQPQYSYTENTKLKAGPFAGQKAVFNQIGPYRSSSDTFQSAWAYRTVQVPGLRRGVAGHPCI